MHPPGTESPRFTRTHALVLVGLVAALWHLAFVGGTSLAIHNDGVDYLNTAVPLWADGSFQISTFRTPGYPGLLAMSFLLFGFSGVAVMLVQHALGVATAIIVTCTSMRFVRPLWAVVPGLFVALDPMLGVFASILQTEGPSVFVFVLAFHLATAEHRRAAWSGAALGLVLGYAILLRPGYQVVLPFLALAPALRPGLSVLARARVLAAVAAGCAVMIGPWLVFNARRGINGIADGGSVALWVSLVQQDLLDRSVAAELPEDMRRRYEPVAREIGASNAMWAFVGAPRDDPHGNAEARAIMKNWARRSVLEHPERYLARLPYALLWQMNYFPRSGPPFVTTQFGWMCWMVSCDADDMPGRLVNFHFDGIEEDLRPLSMPGKNGWMRRLTLWWSNAHPPGFPQLPLCVIAVAAGVLALRQKRWNIAVALLGSAALVGVHTVMVFHQGRYSYPAVIAWWGIAPYPIAHAVTLARAAWARRAGVPATT